MYALIFMSDAFTEGTPRGFVSPPGLQPGIFPHDRQTGKPLLCEATE